MRGLYFLPCIITGPVYSTMHIRTYNKCASDKQRRHHAHNTRNSTMMKILAHKKHYSIFLLQAKVWLCHGACIHA